MNIRHQPRRWFLGLFLAPSIGIALWLNLSQDLHPLLAWWIGCNLSVFPIWAYDKRQARKSGWRVPEATLHGMAILGAAPGSLAAMTLLRHKTLKRTFKILYWTLTLLQLGGLIYWLSTR